jgi:hypothetical protein
LQLLDGGCRVEKGDKIAFVIYLFRRRFSPITCHSSNFYFRIFCPRKLDMTHLNLVLLGSESSFDFCFLRLESLVLLQN